MTDRERWRTTTDPAWMLNALGDAADERRLLTAMHAVQSYWDAKTSPHQWGLRGGIEAKNWLGIISIIDDKSVPAFACDTIRCLWPSPFIERERVECEKCLGSSMVWNRINERCDCGNGFTLTPLINPRWRTPLVLDLARQVMGTAVGWEITASGKIDHAKPMAWEIGKEPNPELMPILADAIEEAGCDLPEIGDHLRCGVHVEECWVIGMLLDGR